MSESKKTRVDRTALKNEIIRLCSLFSVSGFEHRAADKIKDIYKSFDEILTDRVGSCVLVKRCGRDGAAKILIDAHLDEVGMLVSDVLEGGFLRIVNVGGIDPAIMQASDVVVYAKKEIRGVVVSIPPHLRSGEDKKLTPVDELMVDIGQGYTLEELRELIPIGTPVGFLPCYSELQNGYIAGKSFDDKACAAIAARAVLDVPYDELAGDVYVSLSAREETARDGGVQNVCFSICPDYAMVIDVNLGEAPDAPERETVPMRKGISISYSAATDRELTRDVVKMCEKGDIPFVKCAAPTSTGTNATTVNLVREGIAVVDVGLPLRNMHTYSEVICLDDCEALIDAVSEFIRDREIAVRFGEEKI